MKDFIYQHISRGTESLYQRYFDEAISKMDVQNFTNLSLEESYDEDKISKDLLILEKISNRALANDNLQPVVIMVMVVQFMWADVYMRDMEQKKWIYRVMERKKEDYFPDSYDIYQQFFSEDADLNES